MAEIGADPIAELAEHVTTHVPTASPDATAGEVRASMAGRSYDSADELVVLDGRRLAGIVGVERLFAAEADARLSEVMDPSPPAIGPGDRGEVVARHAVARGESSLAVVDADGRFLGLIPAPRMLALLLDEHDRDLARLGGFIAGAGVAQRAALEPVGRRLWHRLPWLLVGLLGAMASTVIVGSFEDRLEANVLLALFIPAVVYMADAVGTQTETLLIRGLAAGVEVRQVLLQELLTGLILGGLVGGVFLPFALIVWGDADVALAVGVALFASCSIATVVAMLLPALFQRFGRDPAFGSGPLATVIQDLLSIVVYFAVAVAIV
ncbi:MAG: magnesium transporter [Solirubrobacterales bacterium]